MQVLLSAPLPRRLAPILARVGVFFFLLFLFSATSDTTLTTVTTSYTLSAPGHYQLLSDLLLFVFVVVSAEALH